MNFVVLASACTDRQASPEKHQAAVVWSAEHLAGAAVAASVRQACRVCSLVDRELRLDQPQAIS